MMLYILYCHINCQQQLHGLSLQFLSLVSNFVKVPAAMASKGTDEFVNMLQGFM